MDIWECSQDTVKARLRGLALADFLLLICQSEIKRFQARRLIVAVPVTLEDLARIVAKFFYRQFGKVRLAGAHLYRSQLSAGVLAGIELDKFSANDFLPSTNLWQR